MRELEIYIHIPFCVKKCAYCDFLSAPASREERDLYTQTLTEEIQSGLPVGAFSAAEQREDYLVTSVFFGGGTPSLLPAEQIAEIMRALRAQFRFAGDDVLEVTLECNPGARTGSGPEAPGRERQKFRAYRACGINRLSFGLQSADNAELAMLGRIHTWEVFLQSYELAREAGFSNINIDLMSALPEQTAASWEETLRKVLALKPEHLSAYSLMIEEGTPFYEKYHEDDLRRARGEQPFVLPSEEEERRMYVLTEDLLKEAGLFRYEISNYARPGYACRHNVGYWRGTEYMGFGLGSSSFLRVPQENGARPVSVRFKNPPELAEYERMTESLSGASVKSGREDFRREDAEYEVLTVEDEMSEFMILGLRMTSGVSEREFEQRFGRPLDVVYGEVLERFVSFGLLQREQGRIFLTPRGMDVSNTVMAEFLL